MSKCAYKYPIFEDRNPRCCDRETMPGMLYCFEHCDKGALALKIDKLTQDLDTCLDVLEAVDELYLSGKQFGSSKEKESSLKAILCTTLGIQKRREEEKNEEYEKQTSSLQHPQGDGQEG